MHAKVFLLGLGVVCGCSSSNGPAGLGDGSGGDVATNSGGTTGVATGGAATTDGGGPSSGTGGAVATNSGGSSGTTTSTANTGGTATSTGGTATSTGGTATSAGGTTTSTGGTTTSTGGTTTSTGGTTNAGGASSSTGCGTAAPPTGTLSIDVSGTSRDYILALPTNYDPKTPYKLIFAWHGLGGTAAQVASNWYGMKSMGAASTIFVAGQGLQTSTSVGDGAGWPNTNGEDVAFVKALYAKLQGQLCIDQNRVFSVGMSYGGIMSDTLGCQMGDVFRAIAPMSGEGPGFGGHGPTCTGPVAVWMSNGDNDTTVPTAQERASKDYWVAANHCQTTSKPVDPSPCVTFDGCDTGYPVTWCEFSGGHTIPSFAPAAIWNFLSQF
jgi:polyhydroxybutyrate depolymerase